MRQLILVLFFLLGAPVAAQQTIPVLTTSGTGTVAASPDLAVISLGVEVEAPTADRALRANSARMAVIFTALDESGIPKKDIQTSQLSIFPQRETSSTIENNTLKITGFVASNLIQITVRDLPRLGLVLDGLTKAGANRMHGITFGLSNPEPTLDRARRMAVAEAIRKAALYADAAGLALGEILSIDEGNGDTGQPAFRLAAMAEAVPIAEGEITLSATVTLRFALQH